MLCCIGMPVSKSEKYGFDGWTTLWIKNRLDSHMQRVLVNVAHCPHGDQRLRGQYWGWFNIFTGDMGSGTTHILSKFADDTKLCGAVNMLEGWNITQRDPERMDMWAVQTSWSSTKVLHLGRGNPRHTGRLGREVTGSSPAEKDLGVVVEQRQREPAVCSHSPESQMQS